MADLREEARLVRAVYERPFGGAATESELLAHFHDKYLFSSDKGKNFENLTVGDLEERHHKITTLLRACIQDKFIDHVSRQRSEIDYSKLRTSGLSALDGVPTRTIPIAPEYYATSNGTDLFNFFGFCTAFLGKYSIIVGIAVPITGWFLIHLAILIYNLWMFGHP